MALVKDFQRCGYHVARNIIQPAVRLDAVTALRDVATMLLGESEATLDSAWNLMRVRDRKLGSLLYNSAKLLPTIHRIPIHEDILTALRDLGMGTPVIADINFRIDSCGEEKYLFDWHQDYWFSVCSPSAIVAWIPLTPVTNEIGGVEVIPREITGGRILKTRSGAQYNSYADAFLLDEEVPAGSGIRFDLQPGDVFFFRFDVLHRSLPVTSRERSRWTLQARYADLQDVVFRANNFKPVSVTARST